MLIRLCLIGVALALTTVSCTTTTEVNGQPVATADTSDVKRRVNIRLQLASNYYSQRNYKVALEEIDRALQIDPDNAAAVGLRGLIYLDLNDFAQAEANLSRALRLEPDNPSLNNNYGWFLCRTKREKESVPYFEKAAATKLYSTPGLALRNAGACLMQVRDFAAAEPHLKRAFEYDASDPLTKYHLTRLYIGLRQVEQARFYQGLLEKSVGESAETLWLSLRIARAAGDVRGERQYAEELRRRYPNAPETAALRRGAFDD